jgi:hypothetical protein
MEPAIQRKTIEIGRGLFLMRYATAEDTERPPLVRVLLDKANQKNVTLILQPDRKEAVLWEPGSALVVRATAPAKLSVEVVAGHEDGSTAASVRIEVLTQGAPRSQLPNWIGASGLDLGDFQVLGHVAGIGDVLVGPEQWLAGPSAPSRIEGIAIEWPSKPPDIDLHYSVKLAKPQAASGQMTGLGSFAGTRGRAMPVIGMIIELSGPGASAYQFAVEAVFLGSPVKHMTGRRIALSGPTEREPLVGLRIGVEAISARTAAFQSKAGQSSGRVRVFRGRPNQEQTVVG